MTEPDDRTAVLETVEAFFSGGSEEELLGGPLRQWALLKVEPHWHERYERTSTFTSAKVLDLNDTQAVVDVRGSWDARSIRGLHQVHASFDGPARLEKTDGKWLIVDYVVDGQRRLERLVLGTLAQQERDEVAIDVLGVNRSLRTTELVVDVANRLPEQIKLTRAYVLFEHHNAWRTALPATAEAIEAGTSAHVYLVASDAIELNDPNLFLSLRFVAGKTKLDFLTRVPLVEGAEPARQEPKRLPVFRSTWPRSIVFWAVLTAAAAWWYAWLAILVPIYYGVAVYRSLRNYGRLPAAFYKFRYLVDAGVTIGVFLLLWETPAVDLAVPVLVGAVVYVVLAPLSKIHREARTVTAIAVSTAWLILLGTSAGALSPCRLVDGTAAHHADSFARSVLTGKVPSSKLHGKVWVVPPAEARTIVHRRTSFECTTSDGCYMYKKRGGTRGLLITVECNRKAWTIRYWFAF